MLGHFLDFFSDDMRRWEREDAVCFTLLSSVPRWLLSGGIIVRVPDHFGSPDGATLLSVFTGSLNGPGLEAHQPAVATSVTHGAVTAQPSGRSSDFPWGPSPSSTVPFEGQGLLPKAPQGTPLAARQGQSLGEEGPLSLGLGHTVRLLSALGRRQQTRHPLDSVDVLLSKAPGGQSRRSSLEIWRSCQVSINRQGGLLA